MVEKPVAQDQRKFVRMDVECDMTYRVADSWHDFRGICKNISSSGLLFLARFPLNVGDIIEVHITSHDNLTPEMKALAEVVSVRTQPDLKLAIACEIKGEI